MTGFVADTSDGFTFLKLSLSASSASRNIILCVARNRKEIGNVASAGVLLLSRTDELIMRVVGLVRYFRSFEESFLRHVSCFIQKLQESSNCISR